MTAMTREVGRVGQLYDLIQRHIDSQQPYPPTPRKVALLIGVSQTTLSNWREPKGWIARPHLEAIARVTGVPYERVLDAMLVDIGYLHPKPPPTPSPPSRDERSA